MKFDTPATTNPIDQLTVIGKPVDRIDGPRKTTGTAPYAYERHDVVPNQTQAYGHILGAGIAKGRITSIDLAAASGISPASVPPLTPASPTSYTLAEFNALTQVATAFFEALRLERRLQSAILNVTEHERLAGLIQRRTAAEISPPADTTLAQARLQQAISERIQIKKQLDASLTTLAQWTVPLNGAQNGSPNGPLKAPADIVFTPPAEGVLLERAIAHSAQRKRLLSQIDSADAQINVSKAQVWPTVVAGFQHTWGGLVPANYDRNKGYVGLEFQSGAGLSARAGVQAAVSRKEATQQELETLERNLTAQVSAGLSELQALQAQLEPSQSLLAGTTEIVESYLRQYQVGRKNWLDVLNAQREKTQALYSDADTRYGYQLSKVRLMIMTGDISAQQLTALHD